MHERDIFDAALALADPAERSAYLAEACAGDHGLRQHLEGLVQLHQQLGSFLEAPAPGVTVDEPLTERAGTVIGAYKLLEQVGEGGFGVVFLAEQQQPLRRKVALKVLKPGMDTRHVVARFEAERQALALMDHPNIAKVFDGGATASGRPYFVMELVKGVPITRFCDEHRLTPRQRLELFLPVCCAVQHAHQKGIIHRDLKPSNVLVTRHDTTAVVKVIDFGVAKALGQNLTDRTLITGIAQMIGTPLYMSPEQAGMSDLDVDTRSDIYSLGVLLYELLTGTTPFDNNRFKQVAYDEIRRILREEEPPRPSTRLSDSKDSLPSISAQRQTEPARLTRLVRGDLDWIVMKALDKDRNRRYDTANAFAADVQRYLAGEVVQAVPPSAAYRARKFVRRNKVGVAAVGLALVFLALVGSGIGWAMRDRAAREQEATRDREVRRDMLEGEVARALEDVRASYQRDDGPEAWAALRRAEGVLGLGDVSDELRGRVRRWRAELDMVQRLEDIRIRPRGDRCDAALGASDELLQAFRDMDIDICALPVEEAARRVRGRLCRERLLDALEYWYVARHELAVLKIGSLAVKHRVIDVLLAADLNPLRRRVHLVHRRGWDTAAAVKLVDEPGVMDLPPTTLRLLAMALYWTSQHRDLGLRLLRDAQARRPGDFWLTQTCAGYYSMMDPPQWSEVVHFYSMALAIRPQNPGIQASLGYAYHKLGRHEEARAAFARTIELRPDDATCWTSRGCAYVNLNQLDKALADFTKALELDPNPARHWYYRGGTHARLGLLDKALSDYTRATELDPQTALHWRNRGQIHSNLKKWDEAVIDFTRAIELDPRYASAWNNRGVAHENLGQLNESLMDYTRAIELDPAPLHWVNRGQIHARLEKFAEAAADFTRAIELDPRGASAWNSRGGVHSHLGQLEKALADYTQSLELAPATARYWVHRGLLHVRLKKFAEAAADFTRAIERDPKDVSAWNSRGVAYWNLGQPEKALPDFTRAIGLAPATARYWWNRGLLHTELEKWAEAAADFSKVIELEPKRARAWNVRGAAYRTLGDLEKALADGTRAIELDPTPGHWRNRGLTRMRLEQWQEAAADFSKVIELDPKASPAWHQRGKAHLNVSGDAKALDKAVADLTRAHELDSQDPEVLHDRATAYARLGRWARAIADQNRLVEMAPKSALAHNDLAWLLATCPQERLRDPKRAVELARKAVELEPKEGGYWNTLGAAQYRAGSWKGAVEALEKSMALSKGGDAIDWFLLAMAHWRLDRKDEARKWCERAVKWMEKNAAQNEELRRFRGEAEQVLGIKKNEP